MSERKIWSLLVLDLVVPDHSIREANSTGAHSVLCGLIPDQREQVSNRETRERDSETERIEVGRSGNK